MLFCVDFIAEPLYNHDSGIKYKPKRRTRNGTERIRNQKNDL